MRLGCLLDSLDQSQWISDLGFDYVSIRSQCVLRGDQPSPVWNLSVPNTEDLPLPLEVGDGLVPDWLNRGGVLRDMVALQNHVQRMTKRAEHLGMCCLVMRCGEIPSCLSTVDAESMIHEQSRFLRMAGEISAHHGILIAVEPVDHNPSTSRSAALKSVQSLLKQVDHPCVGVSLGPEAFAADEHCDEALFSIAPLMAHVHIPGHASQSQYDPRLHDHDAQSCGDNPRGDAKDDRLTATMFSLLRKMGYDSRITIPFASVRQRIGLNDGDPSLREQFRQQMRGLIVGWRQAWDHAGRLEGVVDVP